MLSARPSPLQGWPRPSRSARTSGPNATAKLIARGLLLIARQRTHRGLIPAGETALLCRFLALSGRPGWFAWALRRRWARRTLLAAEAFLLPGIFTHYLARKRWIEHVVRQLVADGTRQVIVLGAGFDTLAWRLRAEAPDLRLIEIDHPSTQAAKHRALARIPGPALLGLDLATDTLRSVLAACPEFSTKAPTVVIAEGLLMYFPPARAASLLQEMAGLVSAQTDVVLTFMEPTPRGRLAFQGGRPGLIDWWLRRCRESFRWGTARSTLGAFLAPCGLGIVSVADHNSLRREVLAPRRLGHLRLARGECLCHARLVRPGTEALHQ